MNDSIDRSDIVWIVVCSHHYWGASNSLHEAMRNANLPEPVSPAKFFAEELEYNFDLNEVIKSWDEWGKEESSAPSGDVHTVVIYKFDPGLWANYHVSPYAGGVSFDQREDMECDDWDAEMDKASIVAEYKDGVLRVKS